MKKIVLAILLTGVAGFVGALAGLLVALIIAEPLKAIFQPDEWGLSSAVALALIVSPIFGAIACITFCWRRIYKRTNGFQQSPKSARCLRCGYILYKSQGQSCPECGQTISNKQQVHLKRLERSHRRE